MNKKKFILIICDGMGDLPLAELGDKTPLEAAFTPNLNRMAKCGKTGLMHVMGEGIRPNSDEAHLTLFGYNLPQDYPGRGPIEALGVGLTLGEKDITLRGNLATVDKDLRVIDRRAGRIKDPTPFVKNLNGMKINGVEFLVKPGTGHRVIIVMRGEGLSDKISNSDVHYPAQDKILTDWSLLPVNKIVPLDSTSKAKNSAEILQKFLDISHKILEKNPLNQNRKLKANYILTRGAGRYKKIPTFKEKFGISACCIAGGGLYKGLGRVMGMEIIKVRGATGLANTDVSAKIMAAKKSLDNYNFVFVHIKPPDIFGEDGDFLGKKNFIEKTDRAIDGLDEEETVIAVTSDHSTPCSLKDHSKDPVPLLIYQRGREGDGFNKFSERNCQKGSLGMIEGKNFMKLIFEN